MTTAAMAPAPSQNDLLEDFGLRLNQRLLGSLDALVADHRHGRIDRSTFLRSLRALEPLTGFMDPEIRESVLGAIEKEEQSPASLSELPIVRVKDGRITVVTVHRRSASLYLTRQMKEGGVGRIHYRFDEADEPHRLLNEYLKKILASLKGSGWLAPSDYLERRVME